MNTPTESPPRYEIMTVHDFLQVPADRLAACLEEFTEFLAFCRHMDAQLLAMMPADSSPITEAIKAKSFAWIDDGERHVKITLSAADPA